MDLGVGSQRLELALQTIRHGVEGVGKIVELVTAAHIDPGRKITIGDPLGGLGEPVERHQAPPNCEAAENQHHPEAHEHHKGKGPLEVLHRVEQVLHQVEYLDLGLNEDKGPILDQKPRLEKEVAIPRHEVLPLVSHLEGAVVRADGLGGHQGLHLLTSCERAEEEVASFVEGAQLDAVGNHVAFGDSPEIIIRDKAHHHAGPWCGGVEEARHRRNRPPTSLAAEGQ